MTDKERMRLAMKYMHARHTHPDDVRCSDAGDEGHTAWKNAACSNCRKYAAKQKRRS